MIARLAAISLCASMFVLAHAGPGGAASDADTVIGLERALWSAWKTHDFRTIETLTGADYFSVNEEGPGAAIGLEDLRSDFANYRLREFHLGRIAARVVGPDTIVLVYNARIDGTAGGKDVSRAVSEASVWARRDGKWLNVLLHEVTRTNHEDGVDP